MPRLQLTHEMELMGKLRAGNARPLPTLRFTPLFYCKTNPHPGAGLAGRTGVGVVGFRRL